MRHEAGTKKDAQREVAKSVLECWERYRVVSSSGIRLVVRSKTMTMLLYSTPLLVIQQTKVKK